MERGPCLAMKNPDQSSLFITGRKLLDKKIPVILVRILTAAGSTPRDAGTLMLVTENKVFGTIGGGRLEWIACEEARQMITQSHPKKNMEISLGPEIGQCCGGRVSLEFNALTPDLLFILDVTEKEAKKPKVQIHGAGHTGKALCNALALLPLDVEIIDARKEPLEKLPVSINVQHSSIPEQAVRRAEPGTAFVIFTHDHQLDFLISAEALKRGDAAYVGMIGSKTKRAVFKSWLTDNQYSPDLIDKLTSPIGGLRVKDKRPEVIAALVAAELLQVFS